MGPDPGSVHINQPLGTKTKERKAAQTKTEGGVEYPAAAYAYTPDLSSPSTWKLRLWESPETKITAAQVGRATAALGEGFRGNKVEIPSSDLKSVKLKVLTAWRSVHPDAKAEDVPEILSKGILMTPEEIQKKLEELEGVLKTETARADRFEAIAKLSVEERAAYEALPVEKRDEYLAADTTVRKTLVAKNDPTQDPVIQKQLTDLQKKHDDEVVELKKRLDVQDAVIKAEKDRADKIAFAKRADTEIPHLPGTSEEKGASLRCITEKLSKEEVEAVVKLLVSGNEALSQLTKGKGSDARDNSNGSVDQKVAALVNKRMEEQKGISKHEATIQIFRENPDLYEAGGKQ